MVSKVPRHYRADITARDTTVPTIPRGDTTASDFTARDVTARYIYSARHYRDQYFKLCTVFSKKIKFNTF
jgi:ABC-type microcin C transport system permease subunit YejE